jgi:hypothetical protein
VNSSKEKVKIGYFGYDSVLDLNNKNMGNSTSFLPVTHTSLSTKWCRSNGILKIDFAANFYFWTQQWLNRTQLLGLRLAKNLEVLNIIAVGNSLSFLMVHITAPHG